LLRPTSYGNIASTIVIWKPPNDMGEVPPAASSLLRWRGAHFILVIAVSPSQSRGGDVSRDPRSNSLNVTLISRTYAQQYNPRTDKRRPRAGVQHRPGA